MIAQSKTTLLALAMIILSGVAAAQPPNVSPHRDSNARSRRSASTVSSAFDGWPSIGPELGWFGLFMSVSLFACPGEVSSQRLDRSDE